ncbi:MAG: hybrid sensor histidine kinase/response regulator [Pseudomonas sp.]
MIEAATVPADPLDEPALLAQRHRLGRLRFTSLLEDDFQVYMHRKMRGRLWPVALSSIGFMLLFFWVDYRFLPPDLHSITIPIRTAVLVLVAFSLWFANRPEKIRPMVAFNMATLAYFSVGLAVAVIILLARTQPLSVPVTHDGLYLVLLSGTFLLGLPARHSILCSWAILICYLAGEVMLGAPREMVLNIALFLCSFTLMGSVVAFAYEYMLRRAYLNEQLLQSARMRVERESQGKTRFLATASHDLRQPLHAMSLFIEHLQEKVSDPEARKTIGRLAESSQLLQAMLTSLLDISRLSVGMVRPQLRHINLYSWLHRLIDSLESAAGEKGIELQLQCRPRCAVYTDPVLLERLVRNYLNNALMHSGGSRVTVKVTEQEEQARIAVIDNGSGLSREEQQTIFEEFTQLRNPARTLEKGVGLGLSICRQLQHLLEYPSGVESEPGKGASFWVEVPLGQWQAEPVAAPASSGAPLKGRVALVENDLVNREAMETLLTHWGLSVASHADGAELLEKGLVSGPIDLLLTDYHLEGPMNGLELIVALREQGIYDGTAVLITADTSNALEEAARQADVSIIYKPVLPARLRRAVEGLLNRVCC